MTDRESSLVPGAAEGLPKPDDTPRKMGNGAATVRVQTHELVAASSQVPAHEAGGNGVAAMEDRECDISEAYVIFVDNEPLIARAASRTLAPICDKGKIETYLDGDEVIAVLFNNGEPVTVLPDLIVSDLNMDRMSGAELFENLLRIVESRRPRFIVMTGGAYRSDNVASMEMFKKHGIRVMEKPFDNNALREAVTNELRQHPRFKRRTDK